MITSSKTYQNDNLFSVDTKTNENPDFNDIKKSTNSLFNAGQNPNEPSLYELQDQDGADGTRFVVELETHSLGAIQLDGLFFNQPKDKEFDLVIRSQKPFSDDEQQQIAGIYNNYGEITGYRGSLRFEQTQAFPVHPLADLISGESREISA